ALASFPDYAPADALPALQDEYGILRGVDGPAPESAADYATRLKNAFVVWKYAGSPLGLLLALYFLGYENNVSLVQQNGRVHKLNSSSIANDLDDYTSFLETDHSDTRARGDESIAVAFATGTYVTGTKYLFNTVIGSTATLVDQEGPGPS